MRVHVIHLAGPGFRRTRPVVVAAPNAEMARVLAETLLPGWHQFATVTGYAVPVIDETSLEPRRH